MAQLPWQIEMFGGLKARQGDLVLTRFETRKVSALLAYLALGLDATHPREVVAEKLWPEEEWDAIRNRLRHALSSLRQNLEPPGTAVGSVISSDRSSLRLSPGSVVTDVKEFEAALATAVSTPDPEAIARRLAKALALCTGELLPGYYEDWVVSERGRLEEVYRDTQVRYARALAETGDLQAAIEAARRALAKDPLREDVHCDLMGYYAKNGRTSDVIRQYRELERLLREELGVSPNASTCELYDQLRSVPKEPMRKGSEAAFAVPAALPGKTIESDGGAVPLDSQFYIIRPTDGEFQTAVRRQDSIVLVKGPRQVGKTSLLARSLQRTRESGSRVVLTDLQKLMPEQLESPETLFRAFGDMIADQLDLDVTFDDLSDGRRGWNVNFERFMRREALCPDQPPMVWAMDEVDRLFGCSFSGVVFGLFRSWHNERALNPDGPWSRLTLAMAYATEAHLFISDLNQSPFNVGTRLTLEDFTRGEVAELNRRYGSPIPNKAGIERLYELVGGCPYLVRRGLHIMAERSVSIDELECESARDDGPFGDHLRRMWAALERDSELCEEVRRVLTGSGCSGEERFFRLRSAGVMVGRSAEESSPRCGLYRRFLGRKLGVLEHAK